MHVLLLAPNAPAEVPTVDSSTLFASYLDTPDAHTHIPNNTFAGFRYGAFNFFEGDNLVAAAFPDYRKVDVRSFGATGDGTTDDTAAVLAALAAQQDGEILYFPTGTYVISDMLRIRAGNRALMGDGPDKTVLHFQRSLSDLIGKYLKSPPEDWYNRWSNHGGLIWIAPGDAWNEDGSYRYMDPGPKGLDIGWHSTETIGSVVGEWQRGDRVIQLRCPPDVTAADLEQGLLIMAWKNDPDNDLVVHMSGHESFRDYPWASAFRLTPRDWRWLVEIKQATRQEDGSWTVELRQPLRVDIRSQWQVEVQRPLGVAGAVPYIENFAIQGMTLRMNNPHPFRHGRDLGFNGVYFQRAFNCLIHNVNVWDADNGITVGSSKCVTIKHTKLLGDTKRHHGYYFRYLVHDSIVTDFHIGKCGNEALSISYRSSGCVFHNGTLEEGTLDSHRGLTFDLIRSNITLTANTGNQSGGSSAGPRNGARVVHWNIFDKSGKGRNVGVINDHPSGVLAGIHADAFVTGDSSAMPSGDKGILVTPLNVEAVPTDLYRAMMDYRDE